MEKLPDALAFEIVSALVKEVSRRTGVSLEIVLSNTDNARGIVFPLSAPGDKGFFNTEQLVYYLSAWVETLVRIVRLEGRGASEAEFKALLGDPELGLDEIVRIEVAGEGHQEIRVVRKSGEAESSESVDSCS